MDITVGWDDSDWIHVAQDMGKWTALVNTVMNLLPPLAELVAPPEGVSYMQLVSVACHIKNSMV
jgi:hypothetical protein